MFKCIQLTNSVCAVKLKIRMAARYPETPVIDTTQNPKHVSLIDLESALKELTQQVAERKRQLSDIFKQIHQIVAHREATLLAELDSIPANIAARINRRKASLEQLKKHKEDTETDMNANNLSSLLQKHLDDIREELDRILSEQIAFPQVSIECHMKDVERTLKKKCRILKFFNPYTSRTLPIWHGIKEGEEEDQLYAPSAVCIDPTTRLIYVGEDTNTGKIHIFTSEGRHFSTLHNRLLRSCYALKIHEGHIYATTIWMSGNFLKLNMNCGTIRRLTLDAPIYGLAIEGLDIYTCSHKSQTVQIYDHNFKPTKKINLKAISFDKTTPRDIILHKQQLFVLFSYWDHKDYHPDPIQVFELDGTLIRSLVTGNDIKYAYYFLLDSNENVLVSDYECHSIRIFSPDGILMQSIGKRGNKEAGELWYPQGIAVSSNQEIVIVDGKMDNRLQAF